MLKIEKNIILAPYTTLKIGPAAEFFAVVKNKEDLLEAISWANKKHQPITVLGGGSNILITKRVRGLVLKNEISGIEIIKNQKEYALVRALSGENWSRFVNFTIEQKLYGLENLFLIYGTVGAAPVQNIGAYGIELKDSFYELSAINLKTGQEKIFSSDACQFAYRDSIFKKRLKGKYFIYSVSVKLKKRAALKLDYGSIRAELLKKGISQPTLKEVIAVVQEIRNSKLPNPHVLPNAGSFFKNIEISPRRFKILQKQYPTMPFFPGDKGRLKIPAGWLIEQSGFKGRKIGPVGMYEKQALILVNYGGAKPTQIIGLVKKIQKAIKNKFGLDLETEVNII